MPKRTRHLSEMGHALQALRNLPTAILHNPAGTYCLVGSIPYALTKVSTHGTPQVPPLRVSLIWQTEQEAIDALLALGITHFQKADCSWYDA